MIDFEITQENLSKAARQMTKARTSEAARRMKPIQSAPT